MVLDILINFSFGTFTRFSFDTWAQGFSSKDIKAAPKYLTKLYKYLSYHNVIKRSNQLVANDLPNHVEVERLDRDIKMMNQVHLVPSGKKQKEWFKFLHLIQMKYNQNSSHSNYKRVLTMKLISNAITRSIAMLWNLGINRNIMRLSRGLIAKHETSGAAATFIWIAIGNQEGPE